MRELLAALEICLPFVPQGHARFLAEDAIADARHALGWSQAEDSEPPPCGQRCGQCAHCQAEDVWVDEMGRMDALRDEMVMAG